MRTVRDANGAVSTFTYDNASRLTGLTQNLAGTSDDQTFGFSFTAASQLSQRTATNDNYSWYGANLSRSYSRNGLNQYTNVGGSAFNYDARGNLVSDGSRNFSYDYENHLLSVSGSASLTLTYDPLGRLRQTTASSITTDFLYDGDRLSAEYNSGGTVLRRYVHGPGVDEPITWYEGSGTTDRRYLTTDHQGSVIAENGAATVRYSYGPYGEPNAWAGSRFRYTGQIALPEVALYHYKARVYDPVLGRFLQTDSVGYEPDLSLYAYVRNDSVNQTDPSGNCPWCIVGAVIGGGFQAYTEYSRGTLNTPEGALRVALATGAGALGGGAATAIARSVAGATISAAIARASLNMAAGAGIGAAQTTGNAATEGRLPSAGEVARGAGTAAVLSAGGSMLGDGAGAVLGAARSGMPGGIVSDNAAMAERMVQGAEAPGGSSITGLGGAPQQSAAAATVSSAISTPIANSSNLQGSRPLQVTITEGCNSNGARC